MKIKNVPNILSVIRLLMVPIFVWLFLKGEIAVSAVVFVTAGFTDVVDGFIARKFNCTSAVGKILDPLADKALQMSAFLCLWIRDYVPYWMPLIYFLKEFGTLIGALVVFRKEKFVVKSNFFGKLATVLVFMAVLAIALFSEYLGKTGVIIICVTIALYFVFSLFIYGKEYLKNNAECRIKNAESKEE